ncbi:MAG: hypothetical protein FMNOHCHN_03009 [Ignavibacteriaceae bacterium]|nr:hypothetical protein [Ignavibacteriaceae bacterium]
MCRFQIFRFFSLFILLLPLFQVNGQDSVDSVSRTNLDFTPLLVTRNPSGSFYLIDKNTLEVVLCDAAGKELKRAGGSGTGSSGFIDPAEIIWRGMMLYVLDRGAKSVKLFDRFLNFIGEKKLDGIFVTSKIADPSSLTVNDFGEIFISDRLNHTILAADQAFNERNDIYYIENIPGKKMQFPVRIISDGDYVAVKDSAGLYLFDRFLNYINYTPLHKEEQFAGIPKGSSLLIENNTIRSSKLSAPAGIPRLYVLPDEKIISPVVILNRLYYISGNTIASVNLDTLLYE